MQSTSNEATVPKGGERIAMVVFYGAQGSGKSTLSKALMTHFNTRQSSRKRELFHSQELQSHAVQRIKYLSLAVEQDPLQKKKLYQNWLEQTIYPELRNWLAEHQALTADQQIPNEFTSLITWQRLGQGKAGKLFINLLDNLCELYHRAVIRISQSYHLDLSDESSIKEFPPLIILNARCNQNKQATHGWESWLDTKAYSSLAYLRLNLPLDVLRERIKKRGRFNDEILIGRPVEQTLTQVQQQRYVDLELDGTLMTNELVQQAFPIFDLVVKRMHQNCQIL